MACANLSLLLFVSPVYKILHSLCGAVYRAAEWKIGPILHFLSSSLKTLCRFFGFNFDSNHLIRSWFCKCHGSSTVLAYAKFYLDLILIFHVNNYFNTIKLWAHNSLMKCVPDAVRMSTKIIFKEISFHYVLKVPITCMIHPHWFR